MPAIGGAEAAGRIDHPTDARAVGPQGTTSNHSVAPPRRRRRRRRNRRRAAGSTAVVPRALECPERCRAPSHTRTHLSAARTHARAAAKGAEERRLPPQPKLRTVHPPRLARRAARHSTLGDRAAESGPREWPREARPPSRRLVPSHGPAPARLSPRATRDDEEPCPQWPHRARADPRLETLEVHDDGGRGRGREYTHTDIFKTTLNTYINRIFLVCTGEPIHCAPPRLSAARAGRGLTGSSNGGRPRVG
eukprot:scaffold744_cov370-Prasinococcus_capsulatus_cf.AAC.2